MCRNSAMSEPLRNLNAMGSYQASTHRWPSQELPFPSIQQSQEHAIHGSQIIDSRRRGSTWSQPARASPMLEAPTRHSRHVERMHPYTLGRESRPPTASSTHFGQLDYANLPGPGDSSTPTVSLPPPQIPLRRAFRQRRKEPSCDTCRERKIRVWLSLMVCLRGG